MSRRKILVALGLILMWVAFFGGAKGIEGLKVLAFLWGALVFFVVTIGGVLYLIGGHSGEDN